MIGQVHALPRQGKSRCGFLDGNFYQKEDESVVERLSRADAISKPDKDIEQPKQLRQPKWPILIGL